MVNLGIVGIKSYEGRYLQGHTDGEMHASNEHRNTEETWFLWEIDAANHIYALQNWRNGKFMTKMGICAPAQRTAVGNTEKWEFISGKKVSGVENAVAIRSVADGTYLGTQPAGDNTPCGGEVNASTTLGPNAGTRSDWPGWWVLEPADPPEVGRDFWNTVGGWVEGSAVKVGPVVVKAVLAMLAAG